MSTRFIFTSPQFLCNQTKFMKLLVKKVKERMLKLAVVDKAHLNVQHGSGTWQLYFLVVNRTEMILFLESKHFLNSVPLAANANKIVNVLWVGKK